jgi:hypothetical protein
MWYPNPPQIKFEDDHVLVESEKTITSHSGSQEENGLLPKNWDHKIKFAPTIWWPANISKPKKDSCRRKFVKGIEIRTLGPDHLLCGERGVFATEKFTACDIIGEYTGRVVDEMVLAYAPIKLKLTPFSY